MRERNIVIIDNNFAIREVLKSELSSLADANSLKFNIFSSENGIEGLGYLYVTEPDIVIIDTTLPKYSGNELLYYVLTNKRFHNDKVKVLIITESKNSLKVPKNFTVIAKTDKEFVKEVIDKTANTLELKNVAEVRNKSLSRALINNANKLDVLKDKYSKADLLSKLLKIPAVIFYELFVSILLSLNFLVSGKVDEANVKQKRRDLSELRRKHYPNVIISLVSAILFGSFMFSVFFSQNLLYQETQEDTSAYGVIKWFSTLDSEADITTPFEGTSGELVGSPTFQEGYGGDAPLFDQDNEAVRIVNPVEGQDYSLEKGAIEFFYSPLQVHTTDLELTFFSVYYDVNNKIEFKKLNDGNDSLALSYICPNCNDATELIDGADYSWTVGEWLKFRVEWNASASIENQLKIFVDEVLVPHTDNLYAIDSISITPATYIYIGNSTATGTNEANGLIDEFTIYNNVFPPTATPVGTPAPTPVFSQNSGSPSWHSTLDNEEAVTTPVAGTEGVVSGASFIDGPEGFGSSAHFDGDGESIDVSIVQGIDYTLNEGAVEFYYRPLLAYNSNTEINLFAIRYDDDNEIRLYKKDNAGNNELTLDYSCPGTCSGDEIVASADYSSMWNVNEWTHFRVEWDDSAALADQLVIQIDGTLPTSTDQIGSIDPDSINDIPTLTIGNIDTSGTTEAQGSIDDFKIFLTTVIPTATITPIPSDTPTPSVTPIPSVTPTSTPTPIWYSTMDDQASLTSPVYGTGASEVQGVTYITGLTGNATKLDNINEYIKVPIGESEFDRTKGRITFDYKPDSYYQNGKQITFFNLRNSPGDRIKFAKAGDNNLELEYRNSSAGGGFSNNYNKLIVDYTNYSWLPSQWMHFEIFYDTAQTSPTQELRLFMDGVELTSTHENNYQVTTNISGGMNLYLGNTLTGSTYNLPVRGALDEFRIYNYYVNVPTPTPPSVSSTPIPTPGLNIMWSSTMDNASALTTPAVGTGMTDLDGLSYVTTGTPTRTGTDFADSADCAQQKPADPNNFNMSRGKIEYYFKPNVAANTPFTGHHFNLRNGIAGDDVDMEHNGTNLVASYSSDTTRSVTVSLANYSSIWQVGVWMHVIVEWDPSQPAQDNLRLYLNGVEPTHTDSGTLDVNSSTLWSNFTIGNRINCDGPRARGAIDDFKIWGLGGGVTPTPTPSPYPTTPADPIWYSTLDNASALSNPVVGNAASSSSVTYSPAVSNDGIVVDDNNEHVTVNSIPTDQFVKSQGAIEFYYIPNSEETINDTLTMFNVGSDSNNYLRLTKENNASSNVLNLDYKIAGSTRRLQASTAQYQDNWVAGNSLLVRVEWDESLDGTEDLKLYLNGNEIAHTDSGTQFTSGAGTYNLTIGNSISTGTQEAEGIIDEFKIFGDPNARNYFINNTGDGADDNVGDRNCATASGNCTLRAAIEESNNSSATDNIIFNISGSGPHTIAPATELPAITGSVIIDGTQQSGVDCTTSTLKIVLDGTNITGDGLVITGDNVTVKGIVVIRFDDGINLNSSAGSDLYCNVIGLGSDGTTVQRNTNSGITATNQSDNLTIGGPTSSERNLISGNQNGIILDDSDAVTIIGNYIGTNKTGELNKGNTAIGISSKDSSNLEIGGTDGTAFGTSCQGDCNLISSNGSTGIVIGNGTVTSSNIDIIGNYIGTNQDGSGALANFDGIKVTKASTVNIDSNLVNTSLNGIYISSVSGSDVTGIDITDNLVGVNDTAAAKLTSGSNGIVLFSGNSSSVSDVLVDNNIVGGMKLAGIYSYGSGTSGVDITNNYLGTNASDANLSNKYGVWNLYPTTDNTIGGTDPSDGNVIAHNTSYGVYISNSSDSLVMNNSIHDNGSDGVAISGVGSSTGSKNNTIIENSIYDNTRLAINLRLGSGDGANGVTQNDDQDTDETDDPGADGPNDLQNYPLIINTYDLTPDLEISGFFNSKPSTYYRLDFYSNENEDPSGYGEAENHIHSEVVQTTASGNYNFISTPIVVVAPSIPATHETFSATATECPDMACNNPDTMLSTSELGKTGFDAKLLPKSISINDSGDALYISGDGTSLIPDIFALEIDPSDPLTVTSNNGPSSSYNTLNYSPVAIASLDDDHIATVGSSATGQYRVFSSILGSTQCAQVDLGDDLKATDIAVAANSTGSKYAFVTTEDADNELYIIRGDQYGSSYPRVGEYLSEVRQFNPIPYYHSVEWDETLFGSGDIKVQVRSGTTSNLDNEEWYGPDGTRGSFFNDPGDIIPAVVQGKEYLQYRLLISSNQLNTPSLNSITIRHSDEN